MTLDDRPLRVMQIVDAPRRRGAELFAVHLGRWLAGRGHATQIVYLHSSSDGAGMVGERDFVVGANVRSPFETVAVDPRVALRLKGVVDSFQPDIVQVNGARTVKYGAAVRRLAHRSPWKLVYRNIGMPSAWVRGALKLAAYRYVVGAAFDGVVALSGRALEDIGKVYRVRCPSVVIPNAVRTDAAPTEAARSRFRRELGVPLDASMACFVGALSPEKRADRFIDVVASAGCFGLVVGDGGERARVEARARGLGVTERVRFVGQVDDVAAAIGASDILVCTSDTEGIPAVVLEAGWLGVPTVAFAVGGLPECVTTDTGVLCRPGDVDGLAAAVSALLADGDRRRRLGAAAHEDVARRFSFDVVGRAYERFWASLLSSANAENGDTSNRRV